MNRTRIKIFDDPFRAAYLLMFGRYKETRFEGDQRCVVIEGEGQTLSEENYRYRTGYALVNPLSFKESLRLLEELGKEDENPFDLINEDLFEGTEAEDTEEIDLLTEEE